MRQASWLSIPVRLGGLCVTGNVEQAGEEWQTLCDQTAFLMRECAKKIKETPNREIAKQVTAIIVEWVLTGKLFSFAHRLSSRAGPLFVKMAEAAKKEPILESILVTAEGTALKMSETAQKVGSAAKKISQKTHIALKTICSDQMTHLEPVIIKLRKIFDAKIEGLGNFSNKYLKFDYEHILGMEPKYSRKGSKIKGFHLDPKNFTEKSSILEFVDKIKKENGVYQATLVYNGRVVKDKSTFFPADWSHEKVISKICEVYEDFKAKGITPEIRKGKYFIQGITKEGIPMEIYITLAGKVVTAYPVL